MRDARMVPLIMETRAIDFLALTVTVARIPSHALLSGVRLSATIKKRNGLSGLSGRSARVGRSAGIAPLRSSFRAVAAGFVSPSARVGLTFFFDDLLREDL